MIEPTDLHAFIDGELPAEREDEIRKTVDLSLADFFEVETYRNLKSILRGRSNSVEIDQSWKACVKRLDEIDRSRRVETLVSRFAPGLCGAFLLCIVAGGLLSRSHGLASGASRDMAGVISLLTPKQPPKSSTEGDRARWLQSLIRQSKLSTPDHLEIRGIAEGSVDNVPVRRFSARDANGDFAILLIPEHLEFEGMTPMSDNPGLKVGRLERMNCVARAEGKNTVVVIADRPYEDLATVLNQIAVQ